MGLRSAVGALAFYMGRRIHRPSIRALGSMGLLRAVGSIGLLRAVRSMGLLRAVRSMGLIRAVGSMGLLRGVSSFRQSWAVLFVDHNGPLIGRI